MVVAEEALAEGLLDVGAMVLVMVTFAVVLEEVFAVVLDVDLEGSRMHLQPCMTELTVNPSIGEVMGDLRDVSANVDHQQGTRRDRL